MDDTRVVWIRDVVCANLDISPVDQDEVFETFLLSDDGGPEFILNKFLSGQTADETLALAFYKELREEEEWVEAPIDSGNESETKEIEEEEAEEEEEEEVATEAMEPVAIDGKKKKKRAKGNKKDRKTGKKPKVLKNKPAGKKGNLQLRRAYTRNVKPLGLGNSNDLLQNIKRLMKHAGEPSNTETNKPLDEVTNELESSKMPLELTANAEKQEDEEEEDTGTLLVLRKFMKPYLFVAETQDLPKDAINRDFLFLVRRLDGIVPETVGKHEDLNEILTRHFEIMMMNGDFLRSMNQIMTEIYMPLLSFTDQKSQTSDIAGVVPLPGGVIHGKPSLSMELDKKTLQRPASPFQGRTLLRTPRLTKHSSGSGIQVGTRRPVSPSVSAEEASARKPLAFPGVTPSDVTAADTGQSRLTYAQKMIRDELMIHLQKFNLAIRTTITQLEGEVHLEVPSGLKFSSSRRENVKNRSLMAKVEETCHNWFQQVYTKTIVVFSTNINIICSTSFQFMHVKNPSCVHICLGIFIIFSFSFFSLHALFRPKGTERINQSINIRLFDRNEDCKVCHRCNWDLHGLKCKRLVSGG